MARTVQKDTILEIIALSKLLGEFGSIKRIVKLPNGDLETDSHYSFSLALIAFELANQYAPELDASKILLYALVHDLPEIFTGDIDTLTATPKQLADKTKQDALALKKLREVLKDAPHILNALEAYEQKQDQEALFVYWIDKIMTIPTHFYDNGANLHHLGVSTRQHISAWYERLLQKLNRQPLAPHSSAVQILELAYQKMHDELFER